MSNLISWRPHPCQNDISITMYMLITMSQRCHPCRNKMEICIYIWVVPSSLIKICHRKIRHARNKTKHLHRSRSWILEYMNICFKINYLLGNSDVNPATWPSFCSRQNAAIGIESMNHLRRQVKDIIILVHKGIPNLESGRKRIR